MNELFAKDSRFVIDILSDGVIPSYEVTYSCKNVFVIKNNNWQKINSISIKLDLCILGNFLDISKIIENYIYNFYKCHGKIDFLVIIIQKNKQNYSAGIICSRENYE